MKDFIITIILIAVGVALLFAALTFADSVGNEIDKDREASRNRADTCYNLGMIVVRTDAGERCANPRNLVKVD